MEIHFPEDFDALDMVVPTATGKGSSLYASVYEYRHPTTGKKPIEDIDNGGRMENTTMLVHGKAKEEIKAAIQEWVKQYLN